MPSYNKVILIGNITRDLELRFLPNNTAVLDIGLAVNDRYKDKATGEWKEQANFVDCVTFGRNAENISKFFSKGRPIFLDGKLKFEQWEDRQSGQKRSKLKVLVDTWQFVDSDKGQQDNQQSRQPSGAASSPQGYGRGQQPEGSHEPVDEDDIPF